MISSVPYNNLRLLKKILRLLQFKTFLFKIFVIIKKLIFCRKKNDSEINPLLPNGNIFSLSDKILILI